MEGLKRKLVKDVASGKFNPNKDAEDRRKRICECSFETWETAPEIVPDGTKLKTAPETVPDGVEIEKESVLAKLKKAFSYVKSEVAKLLAL